jgi:hypothetical protein
LMLLTRCRSDRVDACDTACHFAPNCYDCPHLEVRCACKCRETQEWMLGETETRAPAFLDGRSAVVWARDYSAEDASKCDCESLQKALSMIPGAKRMVSQSYTFCVVGSRLVLH